MTRRASFVLLALGLAACQGPGPKQVGEATLALALGVEEIPAAAQDAPVVEIMPGQPVTIPAAPVVKLAIDRDVTWAQVRASLDIMDEREQTPVLLVAERRKVRAFARFDVIARSEIEELRAHAIEITAYTDGKVCVRHPEVTEAKCVQTPSRQYIDGAFTRELVREATKGYGLSKTAVDLPPDLQWDDVVRVVDGARTCCGEREVTAVVLPADAFPERMQVPAE